MALVVNCAHFLLCRSAEPEVTHSALMAQRIGCVREDGVGHRCSGGRSGSRRCAPGDVVIVLSSDAAPYAQAEAGFRDGFAKQSSILRTVRLEGVAKNGIDATIRKDQALLSRLERRPPIGCTYRFQQKYRWPTAWFQIQQGRGSVMAMPPMGSAPTCRWATRWLIQEAAPQRQDVVFYTDPTPPKDSVGGNCPGRFARWLVVARGRGG